MLSLEEMLGLTGKRHDGFLIMINHLKTISSPLIVETGCVREQDTKENWELAGMSTIVFDEYINVFGGEFHSVDINPSSIAVAQSKVSNRTKLHCEDSVSFLWAAGPKWKNQNRTIDLLYLDSFDFDKENPVPSSVHHLKELCAILPYLSKNALVAVDDNFDNGEHRTGKGTYVAEFMQSIGKSMIYDGYQLVWRL